MCGFLGEVYFNETFTDSDDYFLELLTLSKQRGPDSSIIKQNSNYRFGFNRLAILDTSEKGNQPKESKSKRYIFVLNGEIYNFKELIKEYSLEKLQSSSDSEVLVHLLDILGIKETLKKLNGMFAIAIYDNLNNTLSISRDFAGIKPLFYGKSKNGIVFASQFNQIFKHPWLQNKLKIRPKIVKEYFGFGYMQAPNTIYKNIYQVNPGELLIFEEGNKVTREVIKKFPKEIKNSKKEGEYTEVLMKVVERQLLSDVPIATFLSGGIDSPLITAVAKNIKDNISAYTVSVDDSKLDESLKATAYANHLKVNQKILKISENDILNSIDEHFSVISEPFGDYSSIPTYLITKRAKKEHTVMLSGDGGDELFFGYPRMLDVIKHQYLFNIPFKLRKQLVRILYKLKFINSMGPYYYKNMEHWVLAKQLHIFGDNLNEMFPKVSFSNELLALYKIKSKIDSKALLHWLRWNEFYTHLQRILIKVDRTSMGNSLEVRVPFLDKESINYAWDCKLTEFKNNSDLKRKLKNELANHVPSKMIEKQKKGFSVPLYKWLHNELKEDVLKVVLQTPIYGEEVINVNAVKNYVNDFYKKKHSNEWGIWHIYAWQKWAIAEKLI